MIDDAVIDRFLSDTPWSSADRRFLAGDASHRRYLRLTQADHEDVVLMIAPATKGESLAPFLNVAAILAEASVKTPTILKADEGIGLALIEDFGDDLLFDVAESAQGAEHDLYVNAIDALVSMQSISELSDLPAYGPDEMAKLAGLALEWYLPEFARRPATQAEEEKLHALVKSSLMKGGFDPVFVHRDYHAQNLIILPNSNATDPIGVIDFQDAARGHPLYDLASLLIDARRDVSPVVQAACFSRFCKATGFEEEAAKPAYFACSAQRNLRILGIFVRLARRDGKERYLDLLPRVWRNLQNDLKAPHLQELHDFIAQTLPPPEGRKTDAP